jgi:uncharacterized membrane protein
MAITTLQRIKGLYFSLGACVIMTSIPDMTVQNIGGVFSIVFLIATQMQRKKFDATSYEYNHATYIIRTFWIWSAALVLGMMIAGWIVSQKGDMSAIDALTNAAMDGQIPDEAAADQAAADYFQTNFSLIVSTTILCLSPAQLYAAWRIMRGYPYAARKEKIPNVKSLF